MSDLSPSEQTPSALTPHPSVNAHVAALNAAMRDVLGARLLGLYLDGSLALGDFDADSDIDFVAVLSEPVRGDSPLFVQLRAMHDNLAQLDSPWAVQVEGSYLPTTVVRRHDNDADPLHPNIERGVGERLKMKSHRQSWDVHRFVLREHGITIAGPPPLTLVDPVGPAQLRATASANGAWLNSLLDDPSQVSTRGYQSYLVLTVCRMRYTLAHGVIASKPTAARWAQATLGEPWAGLIARAWLGRSAPDGPPDPDDLALSLVLTRETLPLLETRTSS